MDGKDHDSCFSMTELTLSGEKVKLKANSARASSPTSTRLPLAFLTTQHHVDATSKPMPAQLFP